MQQKLPENINKTTVNGNAKISTAQHTDIFGKILYYLEIVANDVVLLLNVGKKTHDTIKSMNHEQKPEQGTAKTNKP